MAKGGQRKRDISELAAKVSQQIEKLPEYADRAQQLLHPPAIRPGADLVHAREAKRAVRARRKLVRRRRYAANMLTLWIAVTILCGIAAVAGFAGLAGVQVATAWWAVAVGVPAAAFAVRDGVKLRGLNRVPLPDVPQRLQLPPGRSMAYAPMQRLATSRESLTELLTQLRSRQAGSLVPEASVADARSTAADAEQALFALSGRITAIERARDAAPVGERPALDAAVRNLTRQLEDGVESYGKLLAATGHAVAADGAGLQEQQRALTDATDHLAGIAIALRELGSS